jgi:hypothetical protein
MVAATWKTDGLDDLTAFAMYNSVILAKDCCFKRVEFESKCESVILMLNNKKEIPRTYVGSIVIWDCD